MDSIHYYIKYNKTLGIGVYCIWIANPWQPSRNYVIYNGPWASCVKYLKGMGW
jgi:hypothetical protein